MSTYLLNCPCGKSIPVEAGQAGERVTCECGTQLDVPTLRKLRHLPVAPVEVAKAPVVWSARKGVVASFLIAAGLLAIAAAWSWWTEPVVPTFNPADQLHVVDAELAKISPADAWLRWATFYQPLAERGFAELVFPHEAEIQQKIAERRFLLKTLLAIAAVCAAVAFVAAFWPSKARK